MKSLINGCAAAALLMGLAFQAHAEIVVRDAPIHTIPADADDTPDAAPAQVTLAVNTAPAPEKAEPAVVKALVQPRAPALTPEENAFFDVLGQRVTDAASAYESYIRRASSIDPAFSGASAVQRAVKAGAAYHPVQLEEGIIAYAALIALRDQSFVDGVRAIQNPAFADELAAHPQAVMQVRGAPEAAADAAGVLAAQGAILTAQGKAITKAAYDIQAQAWSKSPVADSKGVLQNAKDSALETRVATIPSKEKLLASLVTAPQASAPGSAPAPDVERGLALAAMAILGKTGDGAEARYEALLHDSRSEECLKLAKLNLNQCLAVTGPQYEDVYCAGRHAVSDTGKCVTDAAGAAPGDAAAPPPRLQEASIGPEQAETYRVGPAHSEDAEEDDDVARPAPRAVASAAPAPIPAPAPVQAPAPVVAPPALAAAAPPAPAPRQYAEAELQPAPQPAPQYAAPQPYAAPPQQYAAPQRAEPMPDPRQAPAYVPQPQPYSYAQNDYAPQPPVPQAPPAQYGRSYAQPAYQQPQYQQPQPYQQPYAQSQYAQQPQYAPQQQQAYASQAQPYYPPPSQPPAYQGNYYGR